MLSKRMLTIRSSAISAALDFPLARDCVPSFDKISEPRRS